MKSLNWDKEKLDKLAENFLELEMAERKLQETIEFVNAIGDKWQHRLAEKQMMKK